MPASPVEVETTVHLLSAISLRRAAIAMDNVNNLSLQGTDRIISRLLSKWEGFLSSVYDPKQGWTVDAKAATTALDNVLDRVVILATALQSQLAGKSFMRVLDSVYELVKTRHKKYGDSWKRLGPFDSIVSLSHKIGRLRCMSKNLMSNIGPELIDTVFDILGYSFLAMTITDPRTYHYRKHEFMREYVGSICPCCQKSNLTSAGRGKVLRCLYCGKEAKEKGVESSCR